MTNYGDLRFKAVIDWIELEISTLAPTNFQAIKRHGRLSYVKPLDMSAGGSATRFQFRMHDVESWRALAADIETLGDANPIATVKVTAIEVSLDAYSKTGNRERLANMTQTFFKFLSRPVSTNRRFSGRVKGDTTGLSGIVHLTRHVGLGRALCIGNTSDDLYQQIYLKQTDHNKQSLSVDQHRARIEIRLRGSALPVEEVNDWAEFDFARLRHYFSFRALIPHLAGVDRVVAEASIQLGERRAHNRRNRYSRFTKADTPLNQRAYDALRELTRRLAA